MIDISTLRAMAKAGASVDVILAAVEAELRAEGERVQARRVKDADRQRRKRHADSTESRGVTRSHSDENVSFLLTESSSDSEESNKKVSKKERARKTFLPDSWLPKPSHYAKGSARYVDQKADDMRNWAKSKAIMRADWDATFHGFLKPRESINGTAHRKSPSERAYELADRVQEYEITEGIGRPSFDVPGDTHGG